MASFFNSVRSGFGRQSNKGNNQQQVRGNGQQTPSPTSYQPSSSLVSSMSPMPHSPALPAADAAPSFDAQPPANRNPPFFFREEYSSLIVKGNFMTLAAKPVHVELGEWLAHQVVEQYRLLDGMLQIIKLPDDRTGLPICNLQTCPTMSAGGHTYTWLDNNRRPIKIEAYHYIDRVQKWAVGKITNQTLFPTDTTSAPGTYASSGYSTPGSSTPIPAGPTNLNAPLSALAGRDWLGKSSGFPESFESEIKSIYRQMMRCYAHLYHNHWLDPFWNINAYKELNTCFIHFINVGKTFDLLSDRDTEPMQPLIDLWVAKGLLPPPQQQQQPVGKAEAAAAATSAPAAAAVPAAA